MASCFRPVRKSFWRRFSTRVSPCYRHVSSLNSWRYPPWPMRFPQQVSETLRRKQDSIANFGNVRHTERVRRKLLQLARDYGRVTGEGVRLDLPLTHALLGEMVGSRARDGNARDRSARDRGLPHPRRPLLPTPHSPGSTGTGRPVARPRRRSPSACATLVEIGPIKHLSEPWSIVNERSRPRRRFRDSVELCSSFAYAPEDPKPAPRARTADFSAFRNAARSACIQIAEHHVFHLVDGVFAGGENATTFSR